MNKRVTASQEIGNRLGILKDVPERRVDAASRGRKQFLAQARSIRASPSWLLLLLERIRAFGLSLRPAPTLSWVTAAILAFLLVLGTGATSVLASQASLPGQGLYPVKIWSEDSRLVLAASPKARLDLTLEFTDRRVTEMTALQAAGKPIPVQVVQRFDRQLAQCFTLAAGMQDSAMVQALEEITAHVEKQLTQVSRLVEAGNVSPSLMAVQASLANQLAGAQLGEKDPQVFRETILASPPQGNVGPGTPVVANFLTGTPTFTPTLTPTPTLTTTGTTTFTPSVSATFTPTPSATTSITTTPPPRVSGSTPTHVQPTRRPTHTRKFTPHNPKP